MSQRTPACPFCGSTEVENVAAWGGQLITSQFRCLGCSTYFEAVRAAFESDGTAAAPRPSDATH